MLAAELLAPVTLKRDEPDVELFRLFRQCEGVHKWHHYFDIYSKEFEPLRHRPIRMLEIGVSRGGSLRLWDQWLHPDSVIVGIDINSSCLLHEDVSKAIYVRIGDQADGAFLRDVAGEFGPFDLILDDGGHTSSQMICAFNGLFPCALAAGGTYLVEDTHSNCWPSHVDSRITFPQFCEGLVELMHSPYAGVNTIRPFAFLGENAVNTLQVPFIVAWVNRISFYDSIVVIEKKERSVPVHERR